MTSGFRALGHKNVRAGFEGFLRERHGLHLTDNDSPRPFNALYEWRWVAERKHHCRRFPLQDKVQELRLLCHAPGNKADAVGSLQRSQQIQFSGQPFLVAVTASKNAKSPCDAYCGSQSGVSYDIHGRKHYWVRDPESSRQL